MNHEAAAPVSEAKGFKSLYRDGTKNERLNPIGFTVATWNVYYGSDIDDVTASLKKMNADVFLLQEATAELFESCGDEMAQYSRFFVETAHHHNGTDEGLLILSRQAPDITANRVLRFGGKAPWKGGAESTRRYIEITLGVAPGQAIRIGNVYPSYPIPVPILGSKGWEDETTTLVELINERKPTILGGDLNASPSSSRVRRIMEETNLVSIPDGFEEKTWTGRGAIRKQSGRKRLDYLFGNPDFVDGAGVIHEAGPSDHRPIIGTFNLEV